MCRWRFLGPLYVCPKTIGKTLGILKEVYGYHRISFYCEKKLE